MSSAALARPVASILFAIGTAGAALLPMRAATITSAVAGSSWILSLTTMNAGVQLILPAWARARGPSVYLLVFMGSQAVGSFVWGSVSEFLGVRETLVVGAVLLVAAAVSVVAKTWQAVDEALAHAVRATWEGVTAAVPYAPPARSGR